LNKPNYNLLQLPPKVEYALVALLEIAIQTDSKKPVTIAEITTKHPIPERYLEQILATLRRGGLLKSLRGAKGGYILAREPHAISLLEIVRLIEGEQKVRDDSEPVTLEMRLIRETWQKVDFSSQSLLENSSLEELCRQRDLHLQQSVMYYI
jgi:Rrf2 family protein